MSALEEGLGPCHLRSSQDIMSTVVGTGHRVTQGMAELISKVLTAWGSSSAL